MADRDYGTGRVEAIDDPKPSWHPDKVPYGVLSPPGIEIQKEEGVADPLMRTQGLS